MEDTKITLQSIRASLIDDFEDDYTPEQIAFIDKRLEEIAKENGLSLEDLDYYCFANSSEMFSVIFDGKEFCKENFNLD